MFSFTRSRSRLRIENSRSRSRPKTGRLRNLGFLKRANESLLEAYAKNSNRFLYRTVPVLVHSEGGSENLPVYKIRNKY